MSVAGVGEGGGGMEGDVRERGERGAEGVPVRRATGGNGKPGVAVVAARGGHDVPATRSGTGHLDREIDCLTTTDTEHDTGKSIVRGCSEALGELGATGRRQVVVPDVRRHQRVAHCGEDLWVAVTEVEDTAVAVAVDPGAVFVVGIPESDTLASSHDCIEAVLLEHSDLASVDVLSIAVEE